jgi:hypothetical protein
MELIIETLVRKASDDGDSGLKCGLCSIGRCGQGSAPVVNWVATIQTEEIILGGNHRIAVEEVVASTWNDRRTPPSKRVPLAESGPIAAPLSSGVAQLAASAASSSFASNKSLASKP